MATDYEKALKELKDKKCRECHGSGKQNDADLGDIDFNEWTCPDCLGTGFNLKKEPK